MRVAFDELAVAEEARDNLLLDRTSFPVVFTESYKAIAVVAEADCGKRGITGETYQ